MHRKAFCPDSLQDVVPDPDGPDPQALPYHLTRRTRRHPDRGAHLARRLADLRRSRGLAPPPVGVLDITLYRDDTFLGLQQPVVRHTSLPFDLHGCTVVLVDDVLYTGRTIRAALDALVDFGRPRAIRLVVLVDRGLREYPIQADRLALRVETSPEETVQVELTEMGHPVDRVVVYRREEAR